MTQITGHAEFCELFLDDVIVPKENLLGGARRQGWKITMHTLGHERGTAALPRQVKLRTWLDRAVRTRRSARGAVLDDPHATQVQLAQALIGVEVLRHHAYRTVGEFLNGGAVGRTARRVKLLMAEAEQRLAATAFESRPTSLTGPGARVLVPRPTCTRAPRASTAARSRSSATSSPTASSKLPQEWAMDLELTDEQTLLSDSLRRCWSVNGGPRSRTPRRRSERARLWSTLEELAVGTGRALGAVELCLIRADSRRPSRLRPLPRQRRPALRDQATRPPGPRERRRRIAIALGRGGWTAET